jgi:hypothetical protein
MLQFMVGYGTQSAGYTAEEGEKKEEKAEKKTGVPPELRSKLIEAMLPIMQSLISIIVQTMARVALPPQMQQQMQQLQAPSISIPKKVKVVASAKQVEASSSAS